MSFDEPARTIVDGAGRGLPDSRRCWPRACKKYLVRRHRYGKKDSRSTYSQQLQGLHVELQRLTCYVAQRPCQDELLGVAGYTDKCSMRTDGVEEAEKRRRRRQRLCRRSCEVPMMLGHRRPQSRTGHGLCRLRTPAVHGGERLKWQAAADTCAGHVAVHISWSLSSAQSSLLQ